MIKKLLPIALPIAFFALVNIASANLTQLELQPQSSFTCNATGTIYYSLSNNQLMLCTSGTGSSPVLTSSGSSGTGASFSTLTVSGTTTLATGSGSVGIGTTNPNSKLQVNGALQVNSGGTYEIYFNDNGECCGATGDTGIGHPSDGAITFLSNGVEDMRIINGNVGIGTTTPGTNLDVNGNINVGYVLYDRSNTNYYLNPSGNVMPYALNVGGGVNSSAGYSIGGNPVWETATITLANGPGWYRVLQTTAGWLNGTIRLYGTGGSNITTDSMFSISQSRYNHQGSIQVLRAGNYNGTHIAELRLGADGNYTYLDVQFAGINTPTTLYLDYSGQISGIQTSPAFNPTAPTYIGAQMPGAAYGVDNGVDSPYPILLNPDGYGSVGIGTTAPTTAGLVVATNVSGAAIDVTNDRIINLGTPVNAADAATKSYVDSAIAGGSGSSVGYWTLSGSTLYPSNTGYNVGIGTTVPLTRLSVSSPSDSPDPYPTLGSPAGRFSVLNYNNYGLVVGVNGSGNVFEQVQRTDGNAAAYNLILQPAGGSVGIGTANPGSKLEIAASGANPSMQIDGQGTLQFGAGISGQEGNAGKIGYETFGSNTSLDIVGAGTTGSNRNTRFFDTVTIGYEPPLGSGTVMAINGSVGIGTASAGTSLDVNGNINVGSILYDRANTNYYVNPSGNIMPYAANLGGSLSVKGDISYNTRDMTLIGNASSSAAQWAKFFTITVSNAWEDDRYEYFIKSRGFAGILTVGVDSSSNATGVFIFNYQALYGSENVPFAIYESASSGYTGTFDVYAYVDGWTSMYYSQLYNNQGGTGWNIGTITYYSQNYVNPPSGYQSPTYGGVASNGYFGVGTANPSYPLSVVGSMYSVEVDNGTATGATTIDWSKSNTQTLVLGASPIALTFNNGQAGAHYTLALKQDATGSRLVTWPGNVRWSSGVAPTLTTTANKTDYVEFVYDGLSSTFDGVGFNANF